MASFVVDAFGTAVSVKCHANDLDRLRQQWSRCLTEPVDKPKQIERVEHSGGELVDTADYVLSSAVTLAAINAQAGERLMFHACGLADPESRDVAVLVAASGTGKTTASVRLSQVGLGYVSDETIAVDDDLSVRAYPKPVSVVIDPAHPTQKSQHGPDEMGMAPAPEGHLGLGAVVLLTRRRDEHVAPTLTRIDLIDGLVDLLPQTSALPRITHPLRTLASAVARVGGPLRLEYSEIEESIELLREALGSTAPEVEFVHLPPTAELFTDETVAAQPVTDPRVVQRSPYLDAVEADGRVMLLLGTQSVVLDGVGALLWRHAEQPTRIEDLLQRCREEFGPHPDDTQIVNSSVEQLISHSVLRECDEVTPPGR